MSRLIPNTLPVLLSDVGKFSAQTTSFQIDTINTTADSNVSAPANAVSVRIQVWGGGGGSSGTYAGGGGGYYEKTLPVIGGTANLFRVYVGTGGTGNASGNGTSGGSSWVYFYNGPNDSNTVILWADGGVRALYGKSGSHGAGGSTSPEPDIMTTYYDVTTTANGANGTSSSGGNVGGIIYTAGGSEGYGGNVSSTSGKQPGGGGYGANTGGSGAAGRVTFTWYGAQNINKLLKSYTAGANNVPGSTAGYDGSIPTSGTINLVKFRGADSIGFANTKEYLFSNTDSSVAAASVANAKLIIAANGYTHLDSNVDSYGIWIKREISNTDVNVTQWFDVRVTKTSGNGVLTGSNATWIQCGTSDLHWNVRANTTSAVGTNVKYVIASVEFRRNSDSVLLSNSTVNLWATAITTASGGGNGGCGTCCFTPETLILMATGGWKRIVDVEVGEEIATRGGSKRVTGIVTRTNRVMYQIVFADGRTLNVSEDHPIYVVDKGYASISISGEYKDLGIPDLLYVGDLVLDSDGKENQIVSIEPIDYPDTVYTFMESEFYANGMLVY